MQGSNTPPVRSAAIDEALAVLRDRSTLTEAQSEAAFEAVLSGAADDAQIGALLALLATRPVTADELTGAARVMRRHVTPVEVDDVVRARLIDTCGTGGAPKTFNISTAAAIIAAGVGRTMHDDAQRVRVAKHGNRSRTGRGSAEVLIALGVNAEATPGVQARCLEHAGVCFSFAMKHHPAMVHAAGPRRSLGFPTLFNLLGPLTNPASSPRQLLGVWDEAALPVVAETLQRLGCQRALVVRGNDGLDEITTTTTTRAFDVAPGAITEREINPAELGLAPATLDDLTVDSVEAGAAVIEGIIAGNPGPRADAAMLNAAAALYIAEAAPTLAEAIELTRQAVGDGAARDALNLLRTISTH